VTLRDAARGIAAPFRRGLSPHEGESGAPFDIASIDCDGFVRDLRKLREQIDARLGEEDIAHLRRLERWGRRCTAVGALAAGIGPNPVSAVGLAIGRSTRWMLMHHIGHRGYDQVRGAPRRYTSAVFARGPRRFIDWLDWMPPEVWIYEHNALHHAHTGELRDPDLVERNTESLRALLPIPLRYAAMGVLSLTWRPGYLAPNILRLWKSRYEKTESSGTTQRYDFSILFRSFFDRTLWTECYIPYAALHFALFPLLYAPFGPWSVFSAWCNSLAAELLANVHTFAVIGPSHAGADLYRYDERPSSHGEACVRQVIGSVNYRTGTDLVDFLHLYLNYQIEHHIWPDIPMLKYQQVQPNVKELCARYGIPYVQESVLLRIRRMLDVAVGNAAMGRLAPATVGQPAYGGELVPVGTHGIRSKPRSSAVSGAAGSDDTLHATKTTR
jgi:fatty acid desaturase